MTRCRYPDGLPNMAIKSAYDVGYRFFEDGKFRNEHGGEVPIVVKKKEGSYVVKARVRMSINDSHDGCFVWINVARFIAYQKFGDKVFDDNRLVTHINGSSVDISWNNIALGGAKGAKRKRDTGNIDAALKRGNRRLSSKQPIEAELTTNVYVED